jgi:hypothetical protein
VDYCFNPVSFVCRSKSLVIKQVCLDQGSFGGYSFAVSLQEIVVYDNLVAGMQQFFGYDAADVAGPTCDEDAHPG